MKATPHPSSAFNAIRRQVGGNLPDKEVVTLDLEKTKGSFTMKDLKAILKPMGVWLYGSTTSRQVYFFSNKELTADELESLSEKHLESSQLS